MNRISMTVGRMASTFCLMLAIGGTAAAQEAGTETHSVKVSLHGIDLGTMAGREQAAQRIAYAVRRDYRASNGGSVIASTDAVAEQDTILAEAMSRLQSMEAATRPEPFTIAAGTSHAE